MMELCLKFTKAKYLVMSPNIHLNETLTELMEELNAICSSLKFLSQ